MSFATVPTHAVGDVFTSSTDWNTYISANLNWLNGVLTGTNSASFVMLDSQTGANPQLAANSTTVGAGFQINRNSTVSAGMFYNNDSAFRIVNLANPGTVAFVTGRGEVSGTIIYTFFDFASNSTLFSLAGTTGNGVLKGVLTCAGFTSSAVSTVSSGGLSVTGGTATDTISVSSTGTHTGVATFTNGLNCNSTLAMGAANPINLGGSTNQIYGTNASDSHWDCSGGNVIINPGSGKNVNIQKGLAGSAVYNANKTTITSCSNAGTTNIAHGLGAIPNSCGGLWATTNVVGNRALAIGFVTPTTAEVKITGWDTTNIFVYNNSGATAFVTAWAML